MVMVMRMMGLMVVVYLCFVWVHEFPWWVLLPKVAFGRIFIHEVCMHYYCYYSLLCIYDFTWACGAKVHVIYELPVMPGLAWF